MPYRHYVRLVSRRLAGEMEGSTMDSRIDSDRYYVITEAMKQADESPFSTRADAEQWIARQAGGIRWYVLTEAEMDAAEKEG